MTVNQIGRGERRLVRGTVSLVSQPPGRLHDIVLERSRSVRDCLTHRRVSRLRGQSGWRSRE